MLGGQCPTGKAASYFEDSAVGRTGSKLMDNSLQRKKRCLRTNCYALDIYVYARQHDPKLDIYYPSISLPPNPMKGIPFASKAAGTPPPV
jgi:hypothetical protein